MRRNNEVFTAWQTITSAHDQSGSGGRIKALQFLNSRPWRLPWVGWTEEDWFWNGKECEWKRLLGLRWEREPLTGLSAPNAYLTRIHLCGADLRRADLRRADLSGADLSGADLSGADLRRADLSGADLEGADLSEVNLTRAKLIRADLSGADLRRADLSEVNLTRAKLIRADLEIANLRGADLATADLREAHLWGADLRGAYLNRVNHLENAQLKFACFWDQAIYTAADFNPDKKRWIPKNKQRNQQKIEEIRKDQESDHAEPDCSRWEN